MSGKGKSIEQYEGSYKVMKSVPQLNYDDDCCTTG